MRRGLHAAILLLALAVGGCLSRSQDLTVIPKGKDRDLTVDQLMAKGKGLLERRKYFRSRATLEQIQSRQDATREILADVNLLIADAYFFDGGIINLAEALSRYTSFLTFYPTHPRADYAQYQLGLSYLKQALSPDKDQAITVKALKSFREVEKQYPAGDWVGPAREQMRVCQERLALSEMKVGIFYMKRKSWPGAVERFRNVLERYPLYSQLDRTYFELARALIASHRSDEAIIYYRKMLDDFPDSRYSSDARDALEDQQALPATAEAGEKTESSEHRGATPLRPGEGGP